MSMAHTLYREQSYDGFDSDEKPDRPRCNSCKACLTKNPNWADKVKVGEQSRNTYTADSELETCILFSESWQPMFGWQCQRCHEVQGEVACGPVETIILEPPLVGDWRESKDMLGVMDVIWR